MSLKEDRERGIEKKRKSLKKQCHYMINKNGSKRNKKILKDE